MKYLLVPIAIVLVVIAIGCGGQPVTVPVPVTRVVTATPVVSYLGRQEQGGVTVQIVSVLCTSVEQFKAWQSDGYTDEDFARDFGDVQTMCEFILEISNATDELRSVFPMIGTVIIGDEQIELSLSARGIVDMDDVSGEIYPTTSKVGGFWIGVRHSTWNEIAHITYITGAPFDADYNRHGEEFRFEIDTMPLLDTH